MKTRFENEHFGIIETPLGFLVICKTDGHKYFPDDYQDACRMVNEMTEAINKNRDRKFNPALPITWNLLLN